MRSNGRDPELWTELYADDEEIFFRLQVREYLDECTEAGTFPDAADFLALHNTPGRSYDYDAVEAEIERAIRWRR